MLSMQAGVFAQGNNKLLENPKVNKRRAEAGQQASTSSASKAGAWQIKLQLDQLAPVPDIWSMERHPIYCWNVQQAYGDAVGHLKRPPNEPQPSRRKEPLLPLR